MAPRAVQVVPFSVHLRPAFGHTTVVVGVEPVPLAARFQPAGFRGAVAFAPVPCVAELVPSCLKGGESGLGRLGGGLRFRFRLGLRRRCGIGIWGVSVEGLSPEVSLSALFSAPVFALAVCGAVSSAQAYCAAARADAGIPPKASSAARPKALAGFKKWIELM